MSLVRRRGAVAGARSVAAGGAVTGDISATLPALEQAATGSVEVRADIAASLPALEQAATGTVLVGGAVSADIAATLPALEQAVAATVEGATATLVDSGTDTPSGGTTASIGLTGVQEGDLLVYYVQTRNSFPNAAGPDGTGWTEQFEVGASSSGPVSDPPSDNDIATLWTKVAGAAETGPWTWSITDDGSDGTVAVLVAFRNASVQAVDVVWGPTTPSGVAGTDGGAALAIFGSSFDGSYGTVAAGLTELHTITGDGLTALQVGTVALISTGNVAQYTASGSATDDWNNATMLTVQ